MHFDQREQEALRSVGLDTDDLQAAADRVAAAVEEEAAALEAFFDEHDVVYSDLDRAHSSADYPEHRIEYLDTYTHAADLRGYLRFDTWGAWVANGRVLDDGTVELTFGPTVHDRVRFAAEREALR